MKWKDAVFMGLAVWAASQSPDPVLAGVPPPQKGEFAFHYSAGIGEKELAWFGRFRIFVSGNILPPDQVVKLKRGGVNLFFYEWLTGFYLDPTSPGGEKGSWESAVHHDHPEWLLNPDQPDSGPDGRGRAYYYDPSLPDLQEAWARRVAAKLDSSGYDGVFFDLVGSPSVPARLRGLYARRHPEKNYDQALGEFLRTLKRIRPEARIFTNQGYRVPHIYLPLAHYDLTESLMTSYAWGEEIRVFVKEEGCREVRETYYRPWKELDVFLRSIETDVRRYNPALKILHLNYVNPLYRPAGEKMSPRDKGCPAMRPELDRPAIYYAYVAAKLWGRESYTPGGDALHLFPDEIYFADLGRPLGEAFEEKGGLVRRYFEKGVVLLNPDGAGRETDLRSPLTPSRARRLWDCFEREPLEGFTVTIEPTRSSASGRSYPAGRVYLYMEEETN